MVGARKALVAMLALVRPYARVNAQVVLQVVVVNKLRVAMEADVGPLAGVLAHVNLQLVLPEKEKKRQEQLRMRFEFNPQIRFANIFLTVENPCLTSKYTQSRTRLQSCMQAGTHTQVHAFELEKQTAVSCSTVPKRQKSSNKAT